MSKALLIDSAKREVREVDYVASPMDNPASLQSLIGGYIETAWSWETGETLYVDEEGLFKPQRHFFRLRQRADGQPLAGNGVVVGREVEDADGGYHTEPPSFSAEALSRDVQFLSREQADAWAKANASEPAVSILFAGPDGKPETEVLERFGHLYQEMPKPKTDYRYTISGEAADGQTWEVSGTLSIAQGDFALTFDMAMREAFERLTSGKAVYGKPGVGCRGPYRFLRYSIEAVA